MDVLPIRWLVYRRLWERSTDRGFPKGFPIASPQWILEPVICYCNDGIYADLRNKPCTPINHFWVVTCTPYRTCSTVSYWCDSCDRCNHHSTCHLLAQMLILSWSRLRMPRHTSFPLIFLSLPSIDLFPPQYPSPFKSPSLPSNPSLQVQADHPATHWPMPLTL